MTLPFPLPDWLPWWLALAALVVALLYLLVFLVMPFSVFGLKGRLDQIEERLDEIQGEIRRLYVRPAEARLPDPARYAGKENQAAFGRAPNPQPVQPGPVPAMRPPPPPAPAAAPLQERAPPPPARPAAARRTRRRAAPPPAGKSAGPGRAAA